MLQYSITTWYYWFMCSIHYSYFAPSFFLYFYMQFCKIPDVRSGSILFQYLLLGYHNWGELYSVKDYCRDDLCIREKKKVHNPKCCSQAKHLIQWNRHLWRHFTVETVVRDKLRSSLEGTEISGGRIETPCSIMFMQRSKLSVKL